MEKKSGKKQAPRQILSLKDLKKAVDEKRAVTVPGSPCFKGPIPAAFMINLQGTTLLNLFNMGMYIFCLMIL